MSKSIKEKAQELKLNIYPNEKTGFVLIQAWNEKSQKVMTNIKSKKKYKDYMKMNQIGDFEWQTGITHIEDLEIEVNKLISTFKKELKKLNKNKKTSQEL